MFWWGQAMQVEAIAESILKDAEGTVGTSESQALEATMEEYTML